MSNPTPFSSELTTARFFVEAAVPAAPPNETPAAASAVADPSPAAQDALPDDGPKCTHCQTPWPKGAAVCEGCGFHPASGTFVPVEGAATVDAPATAGLAKIPGWVLALGLGMLCVAGLSLAPRFICEPDSDLRFYWAITQAAVGFSVFLLVHCGAYLHAIVQNASLTILDFILRPIAIWKETFVELPATGGRIAFGGNAMLAGILGLTVVGGIPWAQLFADKAPPKRVKSNLMQAIVDQARQAEGGADNLEDAVKDFAGKAEEKKKEEAKREAALQRAECLILGYVPGPEGRIASLVLATVDKGRLRYVGTLRKGLTPEAEQKLVERFPEYSTDKPFMTQASASGAKWLKPGLACLVKFERWTERREMVNPVFESLLVELNVK